MAALPWNAYIRDIQRLCIDLSIHRERKYFAKLICIHIPGCKNSFFRILAGTGVVIMVCKHTRIVGDRHQGRSKVRLIRVVGSLDDMPPGSARRSIQSRRRNCAGGGVPADRSVDAPGHVCTAGSVDCGLELSGLREGQGARARSNTHSAAGVLTGTCQSYGLENGWIGIADRYVAGSGTSSRGRERCVDRTCGTCGERSRTVIGLREIARGSYINEVEGGTSDVGNRYWACCACGVNGLSAETDAVCRDADA